MTAILQKDASVIFWIAVTFCLSMTFFELRDIRHELVRLQSDPSCEWAVKAIDSMRGKGVAK